MNRPLKNLYLVSLGCARNQVDSEIMLGQLAAAGWRVTPDPEAADAIVVNTCSFIESAAEESIDTILALARLKETGACRCLVVAGCLPERYREQIVETLPEVDVFLGTGAFADVVSAVEACAGTVRCLLPDPDALVPQGSDTLRVLGAGHMAYLKIAEGCSRHCTYCIIPRLRGRQKSRPPEHVIAEAESLAAAGVQELVLVAQESTGYGWDLTPPTRLATLLNQLAEAVPEVWIRFLYGHPESVDEATIDAVAAHPNICAYFDIPIQHASDPVLKRMGRHYGQADLLRLFEAIRQRIPHAALRTTVIVGFPGETEQDFDALMAFVDTIRFDHLGVFMYSDSEDLPSHRLSGHVPPKMAQKRHHRLMTLQAQISLAKNRQHLGRTFTVLVEELVEPGLVAGRTMFQAPEVDGVTYVEDGDAVVGDRICARITDAMEYDLSGETA
ncbi:MAG: 30S ribosomal protein S12 methylthiotransferase RimO [Desulfobacterales bacterium]|nr:30S ribosomal protein S12 methylthiotransferase RimO [Desulfobacterales bacterium]